MKITKIKKFIYKLIAYDLYCNEKLYKSMYIGEKEFSNKLKEKNETLEEELITLKKQYEKIKKNYENMKSYSISLPLGEWIVKVTYDKKNFIRLKTNTYEKYLQLQEKKKNAE